MEFLDLGRPLPLTLWFPEDKNGFSLSGKVSLSHPVKSRIRHREQKITERGNSKENTPSSRLQKVVLESVNVGDTIAPLQGHLSLQVHSL